MIHKALNIKSLYHKVDLSSIKAQTTENIQPLNGVLDQKRALKALEFALMMPQRGYNLFAAGRHGTGKKSLIMRWLTKHAEGKPMADDWVYVYNFKDANKPIALNLPNGQGHILKKQMNELIKDLSYTIPSIFESAEYHGRLKAIDLDYTQKQEDLFAAIFEEAKQYNIGIETTEAGFTVLATNDQGEILNQEDIDKLNENERERLDEILIFFQKRLQDTVAEMPLIEKQKHESFKKLEREAVTHMVDHLISELMVSWKEYSKVQSWLSSVRDAILANPMLFISGDEHHNEKAVTNSEKSTFIEATSLDDIAPLRRFRVNLLVDNSCNIDKQSCTSSPVIYCENPSLSTLIGYIEYVPKYASQMTDFNLIHAGMLHKANGGTLIIEAERLLTQPLAWETLIQALHTGYITFDPMSGQDIATSTIGLRPEKIPLNIKIILLGNHSLLSTLTHFDADFNELFKVVADFDTEIPRTAENEHFYAQFISLIAKEENLKPFHKKAIARMIEYGSRVAEHQNKLTTHMASITDLLREAHQIAKDSPIIECKHIDAAIEERIFRADKMRGYIQEQIKTGILNIETKGYKIGQINGLSVLSTDDFAFGQPNRITASVWPGSLGVIDIEREVDLGGNLHSKGVMILSAYLASRFSQNFPLSLSASLTFEQSYFGVDGDSASSTEAYALLSALANTPIHQGIAVTGAIDQKGNIQAIGGVNEKIEGFFDICFARGLTGEQGVIIPKANIQNLMLSERVVKEVKQNKFHIWAVSHIDEGMEILTNEVSGLADEEGGFPLETINGKVAKRLKDMAYAMKNFS